MGKRSRVLYTVAFVAVGAAVGSCDKGTAPADPSAPTRASEGCFTEPAPKLRAVFHYLHRLNESEVRSGNLAADRSRLEDVRSFAVRMVDEHAAADQKLVDLARREHIDIGSSPPSDPVHSAALRFVGDEDLADVAPVAFDTAFLASQAELHGIALKVIEEGLRVAAGDLKAFLDDAREMSSQHREHANRLLQDFRFVPRAVGGGPVQASDTNTSGEALNGQNGLARRRRSLGESPSAPRPSDDPLALDAGVWPPVTTPPDRLP